MAKSSRASGRRKRARQTPQSEPLRPELVRSLPAGLPGWREKQGNRALVRRFGFPRQRAAAAFAVAVVELVETSCSNAWIDLRGRVAIVTHFSPRAGGVTLADFQVAVMVTELRA